MLSNSNRYRAFALLSLFLFVAVIIPGLPGFVSDNYYFAVWSAYISKHSLREVYSSETDYLPVYQYFLWAYAKLAGPAEANIFSRIGYLRLATLAFELLSLWYVYKWIDKKTDFLLLVAFSIFNIAFSYNTIIWGQVDGILSALVFISIYYAWQRKILLSCVWYTLAICFKPQAIVFLPILTLLLLQNSINKQFFVRILLSALVSCGMIMLITLPFIQTSTSRHLLYKAVFGAAGHYPYVSMNAFNYWYWFFPTEGIISISDSRVAIGGLTYKCFGLLLFFITSFLALWPLLRHTIKKILQPTYSTSFSVLKLWLICSAIPVLFFFCNTEMHERYSHSALIFITVYAFYSKDFVPYILFSIAYFLNLEKVLQWLKLQNYGTLMFDARFIAGIYCLLILYLFYRIYLPVRDNGEWTNDTPPELN